MNREELDKINADIEDVRRLKLEAMTLAMQLRGWRRWVLLRFVRVFDWVIRFGERVRKDQIDDG